MAQQANSKLRSLSRSEIVGELLELEPDRWALSVLRTTRKMDSKFDVDEDVLYWGSAMFVGLVEEFLGC